MQWYHIVGIVIGSLVLILLISLFIFGYLLYKTTFLRRKDDARFAELENPEDKKWPSRVWYASQKLEELEIVSKDGLKLKGYFQDNHSKKLLICLHGYKGRYYSNTTQSQIFFENGYDVLLPNNRAHDTSEGKYFTMGQKEVDDVLRWINLMVQRNPNYQIVLMGISMGAHIAMMVAGNKNISSNVKCVIEDCGYANLRNQLHYELIKRHMSLKPFILLGSELYCCLFKGFSLNNSTRKPLHNLRLPILMIHGDQDTYVLPKNIEINSSYVSENIYKETVVFEGKEHNHSKDDLERYTNVIINFVNRFIK